MSVDIPTNELLTKRFDHYSFCKIYLVFDEHIIFVPIKWYLILESSEAFCVHFLVQ